MREHVAKDAHLQTDQRQEYNPLGAEFPSYRSVNHRNKEWVRTDPDGVKVTTNHAESYFGNCKRSIAGTHLSVSRKHLSLYMAELDHKYNTRDVTDGERAVIGLGKVEGKRLSLRPMKSKPTDGVLYSEPLAGEEAGSGSAAQADAVTAPALAAETEIVPERSEATRLRLR